MPGSASEQARLACIDESKLRQALDGADIVPLMLSLVHLTGDARWLEEAAPHIKGGWSYLADLPLDLQHRIRDELVGVLKRIALGQLQPARMSDELLNRMMHISVGQTVPSEYNALFREEAGFDERDYRAVPWRKNVPPQRIADFHVLIAGAGF